MATFVILYNWHKRVLDTLIFLRIHNLRATMPSSCTLLVVISKAIWSLFSLAYSYGGLSQDLSPTHFISADWTILLFIILSVLYIRGFFRPKLRSLRRFPSNTIRSIGPQRGSRSKEGGPGRASRFGGPLLGGDPPNAESAAEPSVRFTVPA